jgi:FdhD protein
MHKVKIEKYDLSTKTSKTIDDYVAEERPLHLFLNAIYWATILCSPSNLKEMSVGHLLSEGILKSTREIEEVNLNEMEGSCYVKLKASVNAKERIGLSRLHQRVVTSAFVNQLNFQAEVFRQTGGVHAAAIYTANGSMVALAEDVGRHNAVDKVIGIAALKNTNFSECFLTSTGRLSGDIVFKASKVGLPIVASLGAALDSGVTMAEAANLTLAGFVRGKRMNVYNAPERIVL